MSPGLPPPPSPASTPRIFTAVRARNAIKIADYEYPSFSQGKAPWGRGYRFPLGIVERAGARASITGTRERQDEAGREKHKSLGFVCSPSFFSLPAASRLSRVGWFLRPCALSSLYYPWGKWGTTRSLKRLVRPFHLSCVNVQRAFILHGRENLISLMGFRCQIERH